jgi:hypothetical protein
MEKLFVPYNIALLLKEMGFDEPCFGYYQNNDPLWIGYRFNVPQHNKESISKKTYGDESKHLVFAPTYDQVIDWFIEKHSLYIHVWVVFAHPDWWDFEVNSFDKENKSVSAHDEAYPTKYEALNAGILKAIELIKNKT